MMKNEQNLNKILSYAGKKYKKLSQYTDTGQK